MTLLLRDVRDRLDRIQQTAARAAPGPLLIRAAVALFALLGLVAAVPGPLLLSRYAAAFAVVALLPALAPRSWVVTAVILGTAAGWIFASLVFDGQATVTRLIGLASALYLLHTTAALAAVLPYDAVVRPGLILPWALRAVGVVAGSAGLGVFALNGSLLLANRSYLLASLFGLVVAGALGWLLTRLR